MLGAIHISRQEVRPFTDFIEEFRQAEARFNSSLEAYQADPLSLPTSSAEDVPIGTAADTATGEGTIAEASQEEVQVSTPTLEQVEEGETQLPGESPARQSDAARPAGRPVSPLLQPASRLPRHGSGRHREESSKERITRREAEISGEASGEAPEIEPVGTEPPPVAEQSRPASRYRFDRPAAATTTASSQVQLRTEDNKDVSGRGIAAVPPVSPRSDNGQGPNGINGQTGEKEVQAPPQTKQPGNRGELTEQGILRQSAVQEPPVENGTASVTTPAQEQERRRRHGQDRQRGKEQLVSTPAPSAPTPAHDIAMLCLLALRDETARNFLRAQKWRELLEHVPDSGILIRILESELQPDDPASLNAFMATLSPEEERLISLWLLQKMPTATETMVEKWWQGICQGVVRRRLEAAKNRIKLPELSAGEIVNLQKQILDLQEQLHEFCRPVGGGGTQVS